MTEAIGALQLFYWHIATVLRTITPKRTAIDRNSNHKLNNCIIFKANTACPMAIRWVISAIEGKTGRYNPNLQK